MSDAKLIHAKRPCVHRNRGLLRRLRVSETGNVLAMTAAAIVPLIALIGGAVDMSRIYLTKTRLQQACDAGALAGRKSMSGVNWGTSNEEAARQFFGMNFPTGKYGTGNVSLDYNATSAGAVIGTATVQVPMTLMSVFEVSQRDVTATCTAELQLPNTEVMFVLDTTLSMNEVNPGDVKSRIEVLRGAVETFHGLLENVKPAGSHIRYGFVPYSSTVNVGKLLKSDWIVDKGIYDSRVPTSIEEIDAGVEPDEKETDRTLPSVVSGTATPGPVTYGSPENCVKPDDIGYTDETVVTWSSASLPRVGTYVRTRQGTFYTASLEGGRCVIRSTVFVNYATSYKVTIGQNTMVGKPKPVEIYYHWQYRPVEYSMDTLKGGSGGALTVPGLGPGYANVTAEWGKTTACIEERASPFDMDVDSVPTESDRDTQWQPYLPSLVYARNAFLPTAGDAGWVFSGSPASDSRDFNRKIGGFYTPSSYKDDTYSSCPAEAKKFAEMDAADVSDYLKTLKPGGYTYHDIGFMWGLRLMSREGLFKLEHDAVETQDGLYSRNLIFMTDGQNDTKRGTYSAWGIEALARRRTPTGSAPSDGAINTLTEARLSQLCTLAKNEKHITVWVIAFGTTLSSTLESCASPGRAYQANNADQLNAAFADIASRVAALRITN